MFTPTLPIEDLAPGAKKGITVNSTPILVANVNGNIYATQRNCTHAEEDLIGGNLEGSIIECPLHGAMFDIVDGRVVSLPAVTPLKIYQAKIENGIVMIDVPAVELSKETENDQTTSA